jgi:hypothetical protein
LTEELVREIKWMKWTPSVENNLIEETAQIYTSAAPVLGEAQGFIIEEKRTGGKRWYTIWMIRRGTDQGENRERCLKGMSSAPALAGKACWGSLHLLTNEGPK